MHHALTYVIVNHWLFMYIVLSTSQTKTHIIALSFWRVAAQPMVSFGQLANIGEHAKKWNGNKTLMSPSVHASWSDLPD